MEKLLEILKDTIPGVSFEGRNDLVDSGDITSLNIVMLVIALNDAFDISIGVIDIIPENFNSLDSMMALIHKMQLNP